MAERTYPNDYFVWYNDDQRLSILSLDTTSTDSSERTTEAYDTFQGTGNLTGTITGVTRSGTTLTYTASAVHGLATGDRVSISGTTNFNDDNLSSQTATVTSTTQFTMTKSASTGSDETSITATFTSLFIDNGLRITYKAKYTAVSAITDDLDTTNGLDTSLHPSLVNYVKARLYEDMGNIEQAQYHNSIYDNSMMKQRSRKSGVRILSVPNL